MITKNLSKKIIIYGLLFIAGIAIILSLQTIKAPFFLDDTPELDHVSTFSSIKDIFTPDTFGLKRPVKNLIFLAIYHTGPHAVITAHLLLMALYITIIFTSFFWFSLWTKNKIFAVMATGMWALAPTMLSTATWLSCANIMISIACVLTGLIAWEYIQRRQNHYSIKLYLLWSVIITTYIVAFNAYEAVIVFPCLAFIQDIMIKQRKLTKKRLISYTILCGIALLLLILRGKPAPLINACITGITHNIQLSFASAFIILTHIKQWLWPFGSQEIVRTFIWNKSPELWQLSTAWIILIFILSAAAAFRRKYPVIVAGILWSIMTLLPMCNLLPVFSGPFADYYLSLSSIGLTLSTIFIIKRLFAFSTKIKNEGAVTNIKNRKANMALFIASIIIAIRISCIIATFNWVEAWSDHTILCKRAIKAHPHAYTAQALLAREMLLNNKLDDAKLLAEESLREYTNSVLANTVLGDIARKNKQFKESVLYFKKVLTIDSQNMYAYISLANLYNDHLNQHDLAEKYYRVIINNPANKYQETAYINLAVMLGMDTRYADAISVLNDALKKFPDSKALQHNLQVTIRRQKTRN